MTEAMPRGLRALGIGAAVGGAVLFAWTIRAAGTQPVIDGVKRLGAGFVIVLALSGARHVVRTAAWWLCLDREDRPSFVALLAAYLAGDAIGNVTPFGFFVSEPSKIALVRNRIATYRAISALTIENLFYTASVVFMLIAGTAAFLLSFDVSKPIRIASAATLGAAMALSLATTWVVVTRRRVVSTLVRRPRAREIEDRVYGFAGRHPGQVLPIVALEATFHATAVAEIWFVLAAITGTGPSLLTAFVLEYVNRTITVVFQFVPLWLGVDEAGTALVTSILQFGPAVGVSLALVRKARTALWAALGLLLLVPAMENLSAPTRE